MNVAPDRQLTINCSCGNCVIKITLAAEEHRHENQFGYVSFGTYSSQETILDHVRERLQMLWAILRGKRWYFSEVILDESDVLALKGFFEQVKVDANDNR